MKRVIKNPKKDDDPLAGDMSEFLSQGTFRPLILDSKPKDTTVTLRVPSSLIASAKRVAKKRGMKYQKLMRQAIVEYVAKAA